VTVCHDVQGRVDWADVRKRANDWLDSSATQLQLQAEPVNPDTWGQSPAAQAAQARALAIGAAAGEAGAARTKAPPS
jgi:hypothetical protein